MKLLYDHQAFSMQEYGGISRYFFESIERLDTYPDVDVKCSLLFSNNDYLENSKIFHVRKFLKKIEFKGKRKIFSLINQTQSIRKLTGGDFDIFHPTYYDYYYSKLPIKKPVVLTCYDLIHEKFLMHDKSMLAKKRDTLFRATKIIAISQSTKNDLMEYYGIDDEKITVVHLASSLKKIEHEDKKPLVDHYPPYFLYVGLRNQYKNFILFVKAISPLLRSRPDLKLYCAGGGSFNKEELLLFKELKISDKVSYYSGSNQILSELYSNAIAFFYPSLYEGFGIPILEAMSCGCAVVSSNISSLPEVAQDAALYFDPTEMESILFAAESILDDAELRSSLIKKGYNQESLFSWDKTASDSYKFYKSIL